MRTRDECLPRKFVTLAWLYARRQGTAGGTCTAAGCGGVGCGVSIGL